MLLRKEGELVVVAEVIQDVGDIVREGEEYITFSITTCPIEGV